LGFIINSSDSPAALLYPSDFGALVVTCTARLHPPPFRRGGCTSFDPRLVLVYETLLISSFIRSLCCIYVSLPLRVRNVMLIAVAVRSRKSFFLFPPSSSSSSIFFTGTACYVEPKPWWATPQSARCADPSTPASRDAVTYRENNRNGVCNQNFALYNP
jgi:hypothetical protein